MGFGRLNWLRKLTAIVAVIALGLVALCVPSLAEVERDELRVRSVGIPHVGLAAKEPGKRVWAGIVGVVTAVGASAPVWAEWERVAPMAEADRTARSRGAKSARAPPGFLFIA